MSILLKNAVIADGSLAAPRAADILVTGGTIADIRPGIDAAVDQTVDLRGLLVAPGFIDAHSHDDCFIAVPGGTHKLRQGITTEVTGNCGLGYFPLRGMAGYHRAVGLPETGMTVADYTEYRRLLGSTPTDHACLVAHGNLRHACAGDVRRMCELLELCLAQGAIGLSAGLCYRPGSLADTAELESLCAVAARHDAVFAVHVRDELAIDRSLDECIALAEATGVRLHISHLKAMGIHNHGRAGAIIERLESARQRGLRITADCYPYTASMTGLSVLAPNFREAIVCRGGADRIFIGGRSLAELARERAETPEALAESLARDGVTAVFECMRPDDVDAFIKTPWVTIGTDGIAAEHAHPRTFGAFPRYIQMYVNEKKALDIQTAIHKITALPAQVFGLRDRGRLEKGLRADLVALDLPRVGSAATYENPGVQPEGIAGVMLNGEWVIGLFSCY